MVAIVPPQAAWPSELASLGAVRFARRSAHFDETVRFYRDLVGLPLCATFVESFGSTGAIFGLPGTTMTLEIVKATEPVAVASHEQLCLYFFRRRRAAASDSQTRPVGSRTR